MYARILMSLESMFRTSNELKKALEWEAKFIEFMKAWTSNEENMKHMEIAFFTERSVEVILI